ncbi:MAG: hypothetical protein ACAI25_13355, partial [Planctomycetota bacterium]
MRHRLDANRRSRGGALVAVVITVALAAIFLEVLLASPTAELTRARSALARETSYANADAGLRAAFAYLSANQSRLTELLPDPVTVGGPPTKVFLSGYTQDGVTAGIISWGSQTPPPFVASSAAAAPVAGNFVRFGDARLAGGAYAYAIVPEGNSYYKIVIEGRTLGVAIGGSGAPFFATRLEAHVRYFPPPPVSLPGELNVSSPSMAVADFHLETANGYVTGTDASTPASSPLLGVAFDERLSFGPGTSNLTKKGGGTIEGAASLAPLQPSLSSVGQASLASVDAVTASLSALAPSATYGPLKNQSDITAGETLIAASSITLASSNTIGTFESPVVTIIQPTTVPTSPVLNISGGGSYHGLVYIDLSKVPGPGPIELPDTLVTLTGRGSMNGLVVVNLPAAPIAPRPTKTILNAVGQDVLMGVAV